MHYVKAKTAIYEFTLLVFVFFYCHLTASNCHKLKYQQSIDNKGRNVSLNHIKRHFKSAYFIKFINSILDAASFMIH